MPHCYSQFHSEAPTATHSFTAGLFHFRMSKSNHSFPHWQGGVKRLPVTQVHPPGLLIAIQNMLLFPKTKRGQAFSQVAALAGDGMPRK